MVNKPTSIMLLTLISYTLVFIGKYYKLKNNNEINISHDNNHKFNDKKPYITNLSKHAYK